MDESLIEKTERQFCQTDVSTSTDFKPIRWNWGNRMLWGDEYEITAVEINPKVAAEYQRRYPNDIVIVADAHEYLLHNYKRFNII